jgi:phosphate-selective porin OprO/OprP
MLAACCFLPAFFSLSAKAQDDSFVPPPAVIFPAADSPAELSLEERMNRLEATNQDFLNQIEQLQANNARLMQQLQETSQLSLDPDAVGQTGGGQIVPAQMLFDDQPPDIRTDQRPSQRMIHSEEHNPFKKPLVWGSEDGEWTLQFHNETQLDIRTYAQAHMDPVNQTGLYIPRMRLIFNGHLSRPIEYNVSLNKGLGSLDLLDAYFNFNYDERFQGRIGRYRVPFTYDWYALSNQFLTTPERSVFAINYGYNRNTAAMLHGDLLDDEIEYAIAVANGPRNSYYDTNTAKDILLYLNYRPFENVEEDGPLQNLNIGGSFCYGEQDQSPLPIDFHTSASATTSGGTTVGVPTFLHLNSNVVERGKRMMWESHLAYYYKSLTVQAAMDGGENTYAFSNAAGSVPVSVWAWHAQFGYFLTGEELDRRTQVDVKRPFDLRKGKRGIGAWEIQARFDRFQLDGDVFSKGLADPTLWTNRVNTIDCGVNWYLNRYVRIAFDWQHAQYGSPVQYAPGKLSDSSDLFWIRFQDYF